jgi:signal transduction histidine kinase
LVRTADPLSINARLRVSILILVITIVGALSVLHLYGVIGEALEDAGERAFIVGEQVRTYLTEALNIEAAKLPHSGAEQKAAWQRLIQNDPILPRVLRKSSTHSPQVIEVVVVDDNNLVLAGSDPQTVGMVHAGNRTFAQWQGQNLWARMDQLFRRSEDYAVTLPVAAGPDSQPAFTIRVLISSALLRAAILPKLRELGLISAGSLLMSALLAVLVSNLVSRSLQQISEKIDRIAHGESSGVSGTLESPELLTLESKLELLGHQYQGVREDVLHLRSNIDHLLRNLEEAVLVFGAEGRLQMAGEPALRLFGKKREDLFGQTIDDLFPRWTPIGTTLQGISMGNKSLRDQVVRFDRPNLAPIDLLLNVEPVNYGDRREGTLITLRNAETRQQIRSQLDTAQRLSAISRLASGVAHEIKNPLNAMMLHLQIATDKNHEGHPAAEELEIVTIELARLDRVVKTFLDFNRPVELRLGDCDLTALAQEVVALMEPEARHRSVQLCTGGTTDPAIINGDYDLLKQCILNVTMNGLEATEPGGSIEIAVEHTGEECVVHVKDDGCGIPPEIHDRIFNLYFTTKPAGTGIGLAVAYRIVQLHSGTITFDSKPDEGAWFRLRFPASYREEKAA